MTRIAPNPDDWQAGYNAGMSGGSSVQPPEVVDGLAYAAGFIEGAAAKAKATAAMALDDALTRARRLAERSPKSS